MEIEPTPHADHPIDSPITSPVAVRWPPPPPPDPDQPTERLSIELIVTPVVGATRAMRWTSPVSGSCFTLWETGAFSVSRRTDDGKQTAATGHLDDVETEASLDAPHGLQARRGAARFVLDVDDRAVPPSREAPLPAAS